MNIEPNLEGFHQTQQGGRLAATCHWKCDDACAKPIANTTDNGYIRDIIEHSLSRRSFLAYSATAAVVTAGLSTARAQTSATNAIAIKAIGLSTEDAVLLSEGYSHNVVIRWGDPVLPGAKEFDPNNITAESQAASFGYNCDFITYINRPYGSRNASHGLLWANHEYTNPELMFSKYDEANPTKEQVDIQLAAHGGTVVEAFRRTNGNIVYLKQGDLNRRITATTPMQLTGPAAGHDWLKTTEDPTGTTVLGMLNNCAGGTTPWGTILTCEENFNQYFAFNDSVSNATIKKAHSRYGLTAKDSLRRWERFYDRFDLTKNPNEPYRFGWVVEIDPFDPTSTPKKRTAMGRFKHEGATTSLTKDGRVVAYMGDDERFDYVYKFVTKNAYNPSDRKANMDLLDEGTLYVARFDADGSGVWLPLQHGTAGLTEANGFKNQAEVLIHTRLAADVLGATKMDRPEDIERNPATGAIYAVMTNNSRRTAAQIDAANPRAENKDGHIIEILEQDNDGAATSFRWSLFMVCGNPSNEGTYFAGYDKTKVSAISTPDNITFDNQGNMWIATDGMPDSPLKSNDGVFVVPTQGPERGYLRQFMSAPKGAEVCGPCFTSDNKNFFAGIQHPGDGGTFDKPVSLWPDNKVVPRPSVIAIRKNNNGIIGQ